MIVHRKSKGSTVFLVSLIIGIIVFVALCAMSFNYLLLCRARAQYAADATALTLATQMNTGDRIGEINHLQEASRELIFVSRQYYDRCSDGSAPELTSLCDQLCEEARSSHSLVERERQNQITLIRKEVQDAIVAYNRQRNKSSNFALLGLQTYEPEALRVDVGHIAKVNCSARALEAIPELAMFDRDKDYVDKSSKLYKSDVNAKLPAPDSDLDFNFSSLPAYVGKTSAPSRNTNADVFVPYETIFSDGKIKNASPKQIPSAIQIFYGMNVVFPWDQSKTAPVHLVATGIASGASSDSK